VRNNRLRRAERGLPYPARGLGRLEYRGYDSAGVATIVDSGKLEIRRAKGKLENLRHLLADSPCADISESGIRDGRRTDARPRKTRIRTKPAPSR